MDRPIILAYCIPSLYQFGGMERVLTQKANYLADRGYDVNIIVTDGKDRQPCFKLNPAVKLHNLDINFDQMYRYGTLKRILLYREKMRLLKKRLNDCLCRISPDITISMLRRDINIINEMTDGSHKIGEIHVDKLHYRKFYYNRLPVWVNNYISKRWMNELIAQLRKLDAFVTLTHEDAEQWKELENVQVIPNPVNELSVEHSDCKAKQVIAVGRLFEQKGFDMLIDAWKPVADKHPDWTLKIYGDGELRGALTEQISRLRLDGKCILEPFTDDIYSKYRESSIFVLSSRFEGFGLVIVEAMSCGVPVVSFTCPCGPRDIITDGVDGILADNGDVNMLSDKISYLIEHNEYRAEMGSNAVSKAQEYSIDKIGAQWDALFRQIMKVNR